MNIKLIANKNMFKKIKAVIIPFALFLVLMILFTLISYYANLSYQVINTVMYIILVISLVFASLWMSYLGEGKGWLYGLISGVAFLALVFILGFIINGSACDIIGFLKKVPMFL